MQATLTVMSSLKSSNPRKYVLNYDEEENADGITLGQLANALWKVVKGKDKTRVIELGVSPKFLARHKKHWKFDAKYGVVAPL